MKKLIFENAPLAFPMPPSVPELNIHHDNNRGRSSPTHLTLFTHVAQIKQTALPNPLIPCFL